MKVAPEIGTVTALSNNATIFSYPHASLRVDELGNLQIAIGSDRS